MAPRSSSIPPDRYGERILPQFSQELVLPDGALHPIQISGRYSRCTIHQGPESRHMIGFLQDKAPPCFELAKLWHRSFSQKEGTQTYFSQCASHDLLRKRRETVLKSMISEIVARSQVSKEEASRCLRNMPELQRDPKFLLDHVDLQLPPERYYIYRHLNAPDLLPYLRIANFDLPDDNFDYRSPDAADRARAMIKRECQVIQSGRRESISFDQQARWNDLIARDHEMSYVYSSRLAPDEPPSINLDYRYQKQVPTPILVIEVSRWVNCTK
jgi:hypothetical protein